MLLRSLTRAKSDITEAHALAAQTSALEAAQGESMRSFHAATQKVLEGRGKGSFKIKKKSFDHRRVPHNVFVIYVLLRLSTLTSYSEHAGTRLTSTRERLRFAMAVRQPRLRRREVTVVCSSTLAPRTVRATSTRKRWGRRCGNSHQERRWWIVTAAAARPVIRLSQHHESTAR